MTLLYPRSIAVTDQTILRINISYRLKSEKWRQIYLCHKGFYMTDLCNKKYEYEYMNVRTEITSHLIVVNSKSEENCGRDLTLLQSLFT